MCIVLPDRHTSLGTIFSFSETPSGPGQVAGFINCTGFTTSPVPFLGITAYVFLIGMLLAQYTLTGYDASAHMTEETHEADVAGPNGIWKSIVISVFFGYILLLAVWYAMQGQAGYDLAAAFQYPATGNIAAPAAIFLDSFGKGMAIFALIIVMGAQFFCGMASVTTNSRMIYAFSRDGAVPGHRWWHTINKRTRTPTNAIWLAAVLAWLLVAPAYWLGSIVAYFAVTAVGVIGLYIAYIIPIFLRRRAGDSFQEGPWKLGKWSAFVGLGGRDLGRADRHHPDAAAVQLGRRHQVHRRVQLHAGDRGRRRSSSRACGGSSPPTSGSRDRKVMGTPEELAAIEADLELKHS